MFSFALARLDALPLALLQLGDAAPAGGAVDVAIQGLLEERPGIPPINLQIPGFVGADLDSGGSVEQTDCIVGLVHRLASCTKDEVGRRGVPGPEPLMCISSMSPSFSTTGLRASSSRCAVLFTDYGVH